MTRRRSATPPRPVVFARVGWLNYYDSTKDGAVRPGGGGAFNRRRRGAEVENFRVIGRRVYGYVKTGGHSSGINLARLGAPGQDTIEDVLVIFVAVHPIDGGQRIVAWYDGATCMAEYADRSDRQDACYGIYNMVAPSKAACVLHPYARSNHEPIPKGKGALGQSNIFYAEYPQQRGRAGEWIDKAVDFVRRHRPLGPRERPKRPALPSYQPLTERVATRQPLPFTRDPDLLDRSLASHRHLQNQLARLARRHRYAPKGPGSDWPQFDLGWPDGRGFTVVEVKSLSDDNEEHQIRYGIGQLLGYRNDLTAEFVRVRAVLAVEREPTDLRWVGVCRAVGIALVWPETFRSLFPKARR